MCCNDTTQFSIDMHFMCKYGRKNEYLVMFVLPSFPLQPFCQRDLTEIHTWINNYIHYKVWDEMTYPFPNFNGCTVEILDRISNLTPHFTGLAITYIHAVTKAHP